MQHNFSQGDIVWFNFPVDPIKPQFTITGEHPALLLHDDLHPNQTVVLSPISSLYDKSGEQKELKSYHLKLLKKDYAELKGDSFVKLDQIMTFSRDRMRKSKLICKLTAKDKASSHLKLMESLQMQDTIREITQQQLDAAVERVLDEYIKDLIQNTKT